MPSKNQPENFKVYSSVLDYLKEKFPAPFYLKTTKYEVGTVLYTANPYIRTNATVIQVSLEKFQILTDIGNVIWTTENTLKELYLPPICKRAITLTPSAEDYFLFTKGLLSFKYVE